MFLCDYSQDWVLEISIPKKRTALIRSGVCLDDYKAAGKGPYVLFSIRFINQKGVYQDVRGRNLL